MAATATRERVRRDIVRLVHRGLDVPDFTRAATRLLARAVPFEGSCLLTFDPATLLPTGEVVENGLPPSARVRLGEIELREQDVNTFTALARGPVRAASLSDATEGDLDRSVRQREVRGPGGFDDELRVALTDGVGTWGGLTLLREAQRPFFTPAEVRFVASVTGMLAEGLRRAALLGAATAEVDDGRAAGLLVLSPDDSVQMTNRAADYWLDELGAPERARARLPVVILSVAARTRAASGHDDELDPDGGDTMARARVRTLSGRWALVRGSRLGDGPDAPVAVILEEAGTPELAPLIADAYGFTDRERLVTELVARGASTREIANQLHLSAYTVQDHLKAIFEKSGTGSRGELVARLFFDHYVPQLSARPPD